MVELGVKVWYLPSIASKQALYYVLEVVSFYAFAYLDAISIGYIKSCHHILESRLLICSMPTLGYHQVLLKHFV